uniref:Uncharacterized protein n=1 Tax=Anguilla anguilla TaxID=7936 RepID=A0A0E9VMA1_ANGAN
MSWEHSQMEAPRRAHSVSQSEDIWRDKQLFIGHVCC